MIYKNLQKLFFSQKKNIYKMFLRISPLLSANFDRNRFSGFGRLMNVIQNEKYLHHEAIFLVYVCIPRRIIMKHLKGY